MVVLLVIAFVSFTVALYSLSFAHTFYLRAAGYSVAGRLLQDNQPAITRLTTDYSLAASMIRSGTLDEEQMRDIEHRDLFLKALGKSIEDNPYPDFAIHQVRAGDVLMLCSDG